MFEYKKYTLEKTHRFIRSLFAMLLVIALVAGISPALFATAESREEVYMFSPKNDHISELIMGLKKENENLKDRIQDLEAENKRLNEEVGNLKSTMQTASSKLEELERENKNLKTALQKEKAKNMYLENLVASLKKTLKKDISSNFPALSRGSSIRIEKFLITAYAPSSGGINCSGDCNSTAKLFKVSAIEGIEDLTYCAVDPNVVPLYSILIIQGYDKPCVAVDTGGKIKGHHIDIMVKNGEEAKRWGRKNRMVIVIPPQR